VDEEDGDRERVRPLGARERLLVAGGRTCTDAELLALVLGAGRTTDAGARLAERVLETAGGLDRLERLGRRQGAALAGFWPRRAALVRAALELGRRAQAAPLAVGSPLRDAASVWAHFRGRLPQLDREAFYVLVLDGKNRVQGEVRVSEGSLTAALVHPREVFAPAIRDGAAALVLVHNHPSGDPTPSAEDAALTERLRQVGELVGVRILDHVVVGRGRYVSMAEAGRW
jgi:DNA repair protein RadC